MMGRDPESYSEELGEASKSQFSLVFIGTMVIIPDKTSLEHFQLKLHFSQKVIVN